VHTPRPRREVGSVTLTMLRPLFRYSPMRDAYIVRGVGKSVGPVLVERPRMSRGHHSVTR
jgi:hypothetical protein